MNPGILSERLASEGLIVDTFDERRESTARIATKLCRIARSWRPALVHTHRRKEHVLGGLAAWFCGARAVATIHGRSEFTYPWWRPDRSLLSGTESLILRRLHRRLIAVSAELAEQLPYPSDHIVVIPNSINMMSVRAAASFDALELPAGSSRRLMFLGRLVPVKRVDRIIDTLAILRHTSTESWSLFIVGEGPLKAELLMKVASEGLEECVRFLDFTSNPFPWLAQMDALVLASEHEGLPMTALEALALGVPVVSPAIGGLPQLIHEAGLGAIALSDSPDAIAAAIQKAISGAPERQKPRTSALPHRYTDQYSAENHLLLYQTVRSAVKSNG